MYGIPKHKRKLNANMLIHILEHYGEQISIEEAEVMLDLMYDFAKLAVNQQLQKSPDATSNADSLLWTRAKKQS